MEKVMNNVEISENLILTNGSAASIKEIPIVSFESFYKWHREKLTTGSRVCSLFAVPNEDGALLYSVLASDKESVIFISSTQVKEKYPSLTPEIPAMHLFEREIYEQHNILPQGHPWLKPVRFEAQEAEVGVMDFFKIEGDEVHEVAVGPIHAGIIECGHFRFQCHGEIVMHLEISLGYHHRGIEEALKGEYHNKTLALIETIAGDTTIGHAWAYCTNIESLTKHQVPARGQLLRAIALELERLANHTGDLGALGGDVGFLPTSSYCGRLRGDYLNLTALMCGNRFGRSLLVPGGIKYDLSVEEIEVFLEKLTATTKDTLGATALLWDTDSVTGRMMGRGILENQAALEFSMVGPTARASGLNRDARCSHPLPHLTSHDFALKTYKSGDVYARALIREKEIKESVAFIKRILKQLPEGDFFIALPQPNAEDNLTEKIELEPEAILRLKAEKEIMVTEEGQNKTETPQEPIQETLQETIKSSSLALTKEIKASVQMLKSKFFSKNKEQETEKIIEIPEKLENTQQLEDENLEVEIEIEIETKNETENETEAEAKKLKKNILKASSIAVSLIEGWRGEICHVVLTDENGYITTYKVIDPSFHNWMGLSLAMRLQQISDFPLCNKSFNLSYCGHDL